ncbi:hypothetical protein GCK72_015419 [Caenorhabditis remanei]|uniref:F-box domain-containing protein n=1 Tax=Caenorhabditis remanei TaxID=31234 RepID=A0A6A5GWM8_CAERE|nr:hypothetical protein GCK72_015419 [Caenorhabditis remanei]KAF1758959.1 hypothetical protein GCK72_015419 [Caenorhabditis remanei]
MDLPKPFPILRLPFLAIEEVFKAMHPFEIINFSMISKRSKGITMQMSVCPRYSIELHIHETLEIRFLGTKSEISCSYVMTSNKEMDGRVVETDCGRHLNRNVFKYLDYSVNEWKQLCQHVLEIFKKQTIDVLEMTMDAFVDHNVSIIDFLNTNVKSVDKCSLYQQDKKINVDKHTAYLLDNITINSEFHSNVYYENEKFHGKLLKKLKKLSIYNSKWVRFDRLMEIDCKSVILGKNLIWDMEWNVFLQKWIAMETNQNLEYLELDHRELNVFRHHVLYGIPHEVVDRGVKRVLKTRRSKTKKIRGGIDIRRIDGKTATFFVHRVSSVKRFAMSIH